ncbi:MAG TPA: GAF domain-containing protein [Anaerolineales bacterium]
MNNFFSTVKSSFAPPPNNGNEEKKTSFQNLWNWLTAPSKKLTDIVEQRNARLATSFLFAIILLDLVGGMARAPRVGIVEAFAGPIGIAFIVLLTAYIIARTKWYHGAVFLFAISFSSLAYLAMITQGNDVDYGAQVFIYVPISLIVASAFLSAPAVFLLVGLNIGAYLSIQAFGVDLPENIGAQAGMITVIGVVLMLLTNFRNDTEKIRLEEMRETNRELESLTTGLEQRVAERTKALETSAEVSRRLASILDPRQLAGAVVNQVQSAFNYYYAQIYLFDDADENLVLTSGTGEAGTEMMKRGHNLPKGRGLVGRAAENNESILVSDTSQNPDWLPNELLPDTKAEAAIPIAVGDKVLGVLDVQDDVTNDITHDDITLLESLAGQVAISIQNANSYAKAEAALQEAKSLVDYATEGILVLDLTNGLFAEPNENATKIYGLPREELVKVGPAQMSPPTQPDGRDSTEKAMELIGVAMEKGSNIFEWNHINGQGDEFPCEIRLVRLPGDHPRLRVTVTDITERQALQKLTAQRARQQEAINTITQRIQSATTIEEAMQVAARELGHALGNRQTLVSLDHSTLAGESKVAVNE